MVRSDRRKEKEEKGGNIREVEGEEGLMATGSGLVPPTIESMRDPRTSRSEAPEMGGIGDTTPWNQGNPH